MAKILIIDDESAFRDGLAETLQDLGHDSVGAGDAASALQALTQARFDLIFVDFRMPGRNGVDTISLIRAKLGELTPPIVMITAYSNSENTIAAMKLGAFDHLTKPVGRADIERILTSALKNRTDTELATGKKTTLNPSPHPELIGSSEAMREVFKMIGRLAATDTTVLITGETGTGKELVARAIHDNSSRAQAPFVAINCAAIPESLLESELFGHVRGAFTGANTDRKGSFQYAEGGTIFLDEIGDMDATLQAKILRAVQEKEVIPVGSHRPVKTNVRILAATHQNLQKRVAERRFREDLYYRLNVVQIPIPPLRSRTEDIEALSRHFLSLLKLPAQDLSEAALAKLRSHTWPGNIRELKNVIERAAVITRGVRIDADDLRFIESEETSSTVDIEDLDWHRSIARVEKSLLTQALSETRGNRSEAARRLGIQRQLLYSKMKEHRIE